MSQALKDKPISWFSGPRDRDDAIEMVADRATATETALVDKIASGKLPHFEQLA